MSAYYAKIMGFLQVFFFHADFSELKDVLMQCCSLWEDDVKRLPTYPLLSISSSLCCLPEMAGSDVNYSAHQPSDDSRVMEGGQVVVLQQTGVSPTQASCLYS